MTINPDPKKYCIRFRKGKPVLFERANLEAIRRWRLKRTTSTSKSSTSPDQESGRGVAASAMQNLFIDDSEVS